MDMPQFKIKATGVITDNPHNEQSGNDEDKRISERRQKLSNPKDVIGIRKTPFSTLPANVLAEMGLGMLEGAAKYGRHNYREVGVRASVYYDATMRHLTAWWEGEDIDPDSGLSHITKALTALLVYRDAMMQDKAEDDRPPKSKSFYPEFNDKAAKILDKYSHLSPRHITNVNVNRGNNEAT